MVTWHSSRCHQQQTFGLLPRRVHLPIQSPHIQNTRNVLLSAYAAGGCDGRGSVSPTRAWKPQDVGTTCVKWIPPIIYSLFVLLVRDLLLSCAHFEWPRKTQKVTKSFSCDFSCFLWRSLRKVWLRLLAASFNPEPQARQYVVLACGYGLNKEVIP